MDTIQSITTYCLSIPREVPYMGALGKGDTQGTNGLFIRGGNRSVYSTSDHCVLVRIETKSGAIGWGECVAVVAPQVAASAIESLIQPLLLGRDPHDVIAIGEDLYDSMRVRGFFGGFWGDAMAAVDIALWDLKGKLSGQSIAQLLGGKRTKRIPAYISGLPENTMEKRAALAVGWQQKGFKAFKFPAALNPQGFVDEIAGLRAALGPEAMLLCDMHWRNTAGAAVQLIRRMEPFNLAVAEAPVAPEDIPGQAHVRRSVDTPVAIGEELRTVFEYRPRFEAGCMDIVQPEMGRTGLSQFWLICQMARAWNCEVMPHASIGIGIFQAASLQVAAAISNCPIHEYQHSIFDKNLHLVTGDMACSEGYFHVPTGAGLGVEPTAEALSYALKLN
ncbi:MAG: mandelate racemase/muconate lactonizing enzyme family protein [Verrucomicrobia bacterium]|nr:mandelate racemase/muconate lactonizing enzyme family protein [Verrucomicrobiota bacterium]